MTLYRAPFVQTTLCGDICLMSLLSRPEVPKVGLAAVMTNYGLEVALVVLVSAKNSCRAVYRGALGVLHVHAVGAVAKIRNSIVRLVPVDMVNRANRPIAMNIQPCEAVGFVFVPIDFRSDVALVNRLQGLADLGEATSGSHPYEHPALRFVMKNFAKPFLSEGRL